jgi:hypothetical protein
LGILDYEVHRRGKRKGDSDNENSHQACEWLSHKAPECADAGADV